MNMQKVPATEKKNATKAAKENVWYNIGCRLVATCWAGRRKAFV
jgi:hypothetical protein